MPLPRPSKLAAAGVAVVAAYPSQGTGSVSPTLRKYFLQSVGLGPGPAGALSAVLIGGVAWGCPVWSSSGLLTICSSVVGFSLANAGSVSQSTTTGASPASGRPGPPAS